MKKKLRGTIISDKMQKTVVVKVDRVVAHPKYHKRFRVCKKFKAHVEGGDFKVGDTVIIESSRPISKDKKWKVKGLVGENKPAAAGEV